MRISDWSSDVCSSDLLAMESRDVKAEMRSTCLKIGLHANFEIIECFLVCGLILPQVRTGDGNPRQNAAGSAGRKLCLEPRGIEVYTAIRSEEHTSELQ